MLESQTDNALATWSVSQCDFTIEYSLRVVDDIRLAVVDAFFSLPRGGAEIGGILLGSRDGGRTTITDFKPLDCEHATGPSFVLSARDHAKLAALLAQARGVPGGSYPVGWYHSHTRSDIYLTALDLELHRRYFPEPWQVALVLKPHTFQPCKAGFFFQESDGSIRATASYREIVLDPLPARPIQEEQPVEPARTLAYEPEAVTPSAQSTPPPAPMAPRPPAAAPVAATVEPSEAAVPTPPPVPAGPVIDTPAKEIQYAPPSFTQPEEARSRGTLGIIVALTIGLACGVAAYQTRQRWLPLVGLGSSVPIAKAPYIGLTTSSDEVGQLVIRWDRESPAVRNAESGTLLIEDSAVPQSIDLDNVQVRGGSLTYGRQSERVDVVLTIHGHGGTTVREASTYIGKMPSRPVEDSAKTPDDTKDLRGRNKKLEKTVDELRNQLQKEQYRKRFENQSPESIKPKEP
jgi:proteasome lid subunit RPN8/RPN11